MPSKYIYNTAIKVAKESTYVFKVGAVIYKGGNVIKTSCNKVRNIGYRKFPFENAGHAEMLCLHNSGIKDFSGYSMLIVRVGRSGVIASAKPCEHCFKVLKECGFKSVYFTNYEGEVEKLDFSKEYEKEKRVFPKIKNVVDR